MYVPKFRGSEDNIGDIYTIYVPQFTRVHIFAMYVTIQHLLKKVLNKVWS